MNSKAIAAMMAIVMMVVGFTVVAADGSDAASKDIPKVSVDMDSQSEVSSDNFAINEGNYTHYDYTLTWTFKVAKSEHSFNVISDETKEYDSGELYVSSTTVSDSTGSENFTVKLIRDSTNLGIYHLTFDGVSVTEKDIVYTLTATITVVINGVEATIEPVVFTGSVAVYDLEDEEGGNIRVSIVEDAKVGAYYSKQIEITTEGMSVVDYQWYAVNLPAGLTMSIDGYVSGIPTVDIDSSTDYDFMVYATDEDGNVFYGTITDFTIDPRDPITPPVTGFTYEVNGSGNGPFIVEAGDNIILKVNSTQEENEEITNASVTAIDVTGNGATSTVDYTDTTDETHPDTGYYLPNTGSGAYQVQIVVSGETAWFTVYVIGAFGSIEPSIVISGA